MNWKRFTAILVALLFVGVGSVAMAEVHSRFVTGFPVYSPKDGETFLISNTLDFSDLKVQGAGSTAGQLSGVSKSDTVKLLSIPAGTIVKSVGIYIASAWSTAGITCFGVTIGDGDDTDGWMQSVDFGPSASGVSLSGVSGWSDSTSAVAWSPAQAKYAPVGKYYTTADTIDAVIPSAFASNTTHARCTDFVLRIWADCVYPRTQKAYKRTGQ